MYMQHLKHVTVSQGKENSGEVIIMCTTFSNV